MVANPDHTKAVSKAYGTALSRLRQRHDREFHDILISVYEEMGIDVRKRMSRIDARNRKIDLARQLTEHPTE